MTELSIQYACSPVTGDYGNLTVENLAAMNLFLGNVHNTKTGVVYWTDASYVPQVTTSTGSLANPVDGLLEPTVAAGVVSIDTGVANVNGYLYFNDVSEDFDINGNPGNANATDIIALRWTATSQTVRLVRLNGAVGATAVLTQSSSTWEVAIAEVLLDGSGNFSTLTDVRKLAVAPGTVIKIAESIEDGLSSTVTFSNIPSVFRDLRVVVNGRDTDFLSFTAGVIMRFNNDSGNNYDYWRGTINASVTTMTGTLVTGTNSGEIGNITSGGTANYADTLDVLIPYYSNSTFFKNWHSQSQTFGDGLTTSVRLQTYRGWWQDVTPINRVDIITSAGSFVSGSRISLYGIA